MHLYTLCTVCTFGTVCTIYIFATMQTNTFPIHLSPLRSLYSVWTDGTEAAGISGSALPAQAAGHTNVQPDGE